MAGNAVRYVILYPDDTHQTSTKMYDTLEEAVEWQVSVRQHIAVDGVLMPFAQWEAQQQQQS